MPINIITYKNTEYTHTRLISPLERRGIRVRIINYDKLFKYKRFPVGTYIFTDRERLDVWQQQAVAEVHMALSEYPDCYKTFNNPAKILSKVGALRLLYTEKINAFNCYSAIERTTPNQFPVFLKTEYEHNRPLTDLIWNQQELEYEIQQLRIPLDGIIITEYCSEPYRGEVFRRLSAYILGESISFAGSVHEQNWCVKYGAMSLVGDEEYLEEQDMIEQNYCSEEIKKIANLLNIEYGRVDFNIVNSRIAIYEINTNPNMVPFVDNNPNLIRNKNNQVIFENYLNYLIKMNHHCKKIIPPKLKLKLKSLKRR